jgi:PIN domain nuclease of toxin-antitoxin system
VIGPVLLDTCVLIWMGTQSADGEVARTILAQAQDAKAPVYLSPFSAWELAMLTAKGRLPSTSPVRHWFAQLASLPGIRLANLTPDILVSANELPWKVHNDPADRILIATARELGLRIVTRDRAILDYAKRGHVLAVAC